MKGGGFLGGGGGLLSNSLFDLLMPPVHVMGLPQVCVCVFVCLCE